MFTLAISSCLKLLLRVLSLRIPSKRGTDAERFIDELCDSLFSTISRSLRFTERPQLMLCPMEAFTEGRYSIFEPVTLLRAISMSCCICRICRLCSLAYEMHFSKDHFSAGFPISWAVERHGSSKAASARAHKCFRYPEYISQS